MCRNITELRGLEPPATREEIEAAAAPVHPQGHRHLEAEPGAGPGHDAAALEIAEITEQLLAGLPARRQPPKTVPPLRRPEVRDRLGLSPTI